MLDHAFIARYLDSFADEGGMHIILEYASGGTLQQQCKLIQEGKVRTHLALFILNLNYIKKKKIQTNFYFESQLVLSESEVLDWFVQCLLSMQFVHNKGILHRDIKSANVFLSGGNPNTCKLGDFGLARYELLHFIFLLVRIVNKKKKKLKLKIKN
jgi:serine/threonine protein kinase